MSRKTILTCKVLAIWQAIGVDHFALYDSDGSAAPILDQWRGTAQAGTGSVNILGNQKTGRQEVATTSREVQYDLSII